MKKTKMTCLYNDGIEETWVGIGCNQSEKICIKLYHSLYAYTVSSFELQILIQSQTFSKNLKIQLIV